MPAPDRSPRAPARAARTQTVAAAAPTPRRKKGDVEADEATYTAIRRGILSGLLPPGLKLQEPALARVLETSRERVRKALHRLAHERWLDTVPNRGTFVPTPSVDELRAIYEARKIIEPGITRLLATRPSPDATGRLRAHVRQEAEAMRRDDRDRTFRLSTEFHDLLARLTGNEPLVGMLRGLMMRSSLHFALYAPATVHDCAGPHEHAGIAAAIADGDARRAEKLMQRHLQGLESMLSVRRPAEPFAGVEAVFARLGAQRDPGPAPPAAAGRTVTGIDRSQSGR